MLLFYKPIFSTPIRYVLPRPFLLIGLNHKSLPPGLMLILSLSVFLVLPHSGASAPKEGSAEVSGDCALRGPEGCLCRHLRLHWGAVQVCIFSPVVVAPALVQGSGVEPKHSPSWEWGSWHGGHWGSSGCAAVRSGCICGTVLVSANNGYCCLTWTTPRAPRLPLHP